MTTEETNSPAVVLSTAKLDPIAWVRRHPDGALTNEILANWQIEAVRKNSGAWVPLYDLTTAPVAMMDTRHALGVCALNEDDFPALYALQGRRVALVDLGPNAKLNVGQRRDQL
jgi:hypothetical protein